MNKSRIFLFLCLSFIGGVFVQSLVELPRLLWPGILIFGFILAAVNWQKNKKAMLIGFCLVFLVGGAWRLTSVLSNNEAIKQFNDSGRLLLQGVVAEEPDVRSDNIKYKILASEPAVGYLLLVAKKYPTYQYGDKIEIVGQLKTPQSDEDFDYQKYLAKDEIYSIIYYPETKLLSRGQGNWLMEKLLAGKAKFKNSINSILTEPQGAFLSGLLLGEKRGLSENLMADFSRTGTTHIIALSGYNITIIAVAMSSLFNFFMLRRQKAFWLSVVVIVGFVLMTGSSASVVRAAVMGLLVLLAQQSGRLYNVRNALIFAGAVMVFLNPRVLVFDLGFQLSFAATLGLVYLMPIFQEWFGADESQKKSFLGWRDILAATLGAQIAVLPLLIINFNQLSLISPLANLLILPLVPATMLVGFLAALGGLIFLPMGQVIGWLAWLLLSLEIKIAQILAKIPLAAIEVKWNWWLGSAYYLILLYLVGRYKKNDSKNQT